MTPDVATLGSLGASGAVVVLCWLVLRALETQRREHREDQQALRESLDGVKGVLSELSRLMAGLLERDRIRAERDRKRTESAPAPTRAEQWDEGASTDLHEIMERQSRERVKSPALGIRLPRPGTHHDREK